MKYRITVLALALATACAADRPEAVKAPPLPAPATTILVIEPDVRLSLLTATGNRTPRPDWSTAARAHIGRHVRDVVQARGRPTTILALADASMRGRQILLLHDAVLTSIKDAEDGDPTLTLSRRRTWTLGPGARALIPDTSVTHALIVTADGEVTSAARAAFVVGAAAMGVLAHTGLQRASASLVDLESGDIVWRNTIVATPEQDMRDPDGARMLVAALLMGAPL
jgi:hypothetical protein